MTSFGFFPRSGIHIGILEIKNNMYMKRSNLFNLFDEMTGFSYGLNRNMEVKKDEDSYVVTMLLPGFSKEDISIDTEGDTLEVTAKTNRPLPSFVGKEFSQRLYLENLDSESIKGKLENGVLSLTLSTKKKKDSRKIVLS
jgi:HSP20 family molecular chaperone IbpA